MQRLTVFDATTPPNSATTTPGRPGVASDGTNWLVVTCRRGNSGPGQLTGAFVFPDGGVGTPFTIAPHDCSVPTPSVAFDGTNFLVVFNQEGVRGVRVSRAGQVLDADGGFSVGAGWVNGRSVAWGSGAYLVAVDRFDGRQYDEMGVRVLPDGSVASDFPISSAVGEQALGSVVWHGDHFLVAWRDTPSGSGPAPSSRISGARVTADGVVLDPGGLKLGTQDGGEDGSPGLSVGGDEALVTWVDTRAGNPFQHDLAASRVGLDGSRVLTPDGGSIALTSGGTAGAGYVTNAFDGRDWVVAWTPGGFGTQPGAVLLATRISRAGVVTDPGGRTLAAPRCTACRMVYPNAVPGGNGTLLVWVDNSESFGTPKTIQGVLLP